jgi:hypothetical protein
LTLESTTTVVDAASSSESGDVKKVETKEIIISGPDAPITAATPDTQVVRGSEKASYL